MSVNQHTLQDTSHGHGRARKARGGRTRTSAQRLPHLGFFGWARSESFRLLGEDSPCLMNGHETWKHHQPQPSPCRAVRDGWRGVPSPNSAQTLRVCGNSTWYKYIYEFFFFFLNWLCMRAIVLSLFYVYGIWIKYVSESDMSRMVYMYPKEI